MNIKKIRSDIRYMVNNNKLMNARQLKLLRDLHEYNGNEVGVGTKIFGDWLLKAIVWW